ncbi:hypothetical protein OGAPHI_007372 [Ogataea philodendri]|uniref:Uncharacterized protein n=1 Tax=Ogataea philodendri TaxID=1378263 RepID=A0A9P8NV16_9ASCO|nr:uncharacterized protein OGAPHI_007372 [Ogataea philodendri]KAH3660167.1 hypothetical protein OGAPHI_007372 [Ogataea philodendri]
MTAQSILKLNTASRCFVKMQGSTIPTKSFASYTKPQYSYFDMYNQKDYQKSPEVKQTVSNNGGAGLVEHDSMTIIKNAEDAHPSYHNHISAHHGFTPLVSGGGSVSGHGYMTAGEIDE